MQATITYLLTEQAQRAQMAATGQPVGRKQTITVEVAAEDLEYYPINADGTIIVDLTRRSDHSEMSKATSSEYASQPDIPAAIRSYRASKVERQSMILSKDEQMATYLDGLSGEQASNTTHIDVDALRAVGIDPEFGYSNLQDRLPPLAAAAVTRACRRAQAYRAEIASRLEVAAAENKSKEVAVEAEKQSFIGAWIAQHADPEVQDQYRDGLLCRKVAVSLIADSVLDFIGAKLEEPTVCDTRDCPCHGLRQVECIPRGKYPAWKAIKAKLAAGSTFEFCSYRECLRDEYGYYGYAEESAGPTRYAVTVKVPCGPFVFERSIAL